MLRWISAITVFDLSAPSECGLMMLAIMLGYTNIETLKHDFFFVQLSGGCNIEVHAFFGRGQLFGVWKMEYKGVGAQVQKLGCEDFGVQK
jgi:hypothetical protein